jgi:hypothetical protein
MIDEDIAIISSAAFVILDEKDQRRTRKRRWWMTSLFRSREQYSATDLIRDLNIERQYGLFHNFCRMHSTDLEFLLSRIGPKITKRDSKFGRAIPAAERLVVTLRYLATGDSYASLMYTFKISKQLISRIVPEVCSAIVEHLRDYVKVSKQPVSDFL